MGYELQDRLVVGVASSALFDLSESDKFFKDNGEAEYRQYQEEHAHEKLDAGVAYPFIRHLLQLNSLSPDDPLVEVIIMSKNDPSTGLRVMNSIAEHGLGITRSVFTRGRPPFPYMEAFSMSLFLSANPDDVRQAVDNGLPAGQVLPSTVVQDDPDDTDLRIAFDFDGVLGSDDAERVFQDNPDSYAQHESEHSTDPLPAGPLKPLLEDLNRIQRFEEALHDEDQSYQPRLRVAVVTARSAPAHERAVRSLQAWGVTVDEAFFLGGLDKAPVLRVLRPHIFFDDQLKNLEGSTESVASVHIPYGVRNQPS